MPVPSGIRRLFVHKCGSDMRFSVILSILSTVAKPRRELEQEIDQMFLF